ncbi:MAG: hypothetical protein ABJM29_16215 [Rhizobiaceae bacterium]
MSSIQPIVPTVAQSEPADASASPSHNSILEKSYSDFVTIGKLVEQSEGHLKNHHQSIRKALVAVFELGLLLQQHDLVRTFHEKQGLDFPKKAESNLFHSLITKAFELSPREDAKSKYRQILLFAYLKKISTKDLMKYLETPGIEETYKAARNYLKNDFASLYEETNTERYIRAKDHIHAERIGSAIKLGKDEPVPTTFDGYTNAILRVTGRQIEVVAVHPDQTQEEIQTSIAGLVEPEGSRVRAKLKEKNLYPLFTLMDIFSRFVPNKSDVEAMEKAARQQSMGVFQLEGDEVDHTEMIPRLIARAKQPLKEFERLSALVFSQSSNQWSAETRSTLPSFPVVHFRFGAASERVGQRPDLCVFDNHADDFTRWFFEPLDWSLVRSGKGYTVKTSEHKSLDILPWQASGHTWRRLKRLGNLEPEFEVSKYDLKEILEWKQNRPIQFGRKPSFPKFMNIEGDGDQVFLGSRKDPTARKRLGVLDAANKNAHPIGKLTLAVEHINRIAQLSIDYGLNFKCTICEESDAPIALQFKAIDFWCPLTITLPFTVSNYGAPTEICEFI